MHTSSSSIVGAALIAALVGGFACAAPVAAGGGVAGLPAGQTAAPDTTKQTPQAQHAKTEADRLWAILECLRANPAADCDGGTVRQETLRDNRLGRVSGLVESGQPQRVIGTGKAYKTFLMSTYQTYRDLRKQAGSDPEARAAVKKLGDEVKELLTTADLNDPINAILRAGYSLADTGDEFPDRFDTGAPSLKSSALMFVEFESEHFGADTPRSDFSFGGTFGLGPTLAIAAIRPAEQAETPAPAAAGAAAAADTAAEAPALVPAVLTGLSWSLNARPSLRTGPRSELSAVGRIGQTRIDDMTVKLGDGDDAALADVVRNGTGRWAWFKEAGVEFRFYEKSLNAIHQTKDMLLPLFSIAGGLRWDDRLQSKHALSSFTDGEKRYYMKFTVNLVKIFDPREPDPAAQDVAKKPFSLKLSVEHHRARGDSQMPSSNRLLIEASADVLKLFNLGSKPADTGAKPAAQPAPPAGGQ